MTRITQIRGTPINSWIWLYELFDIDICLEQRRRTYLMRTLFIKTLGCWLRVINFAKVVCFTYLFCGNKICRQMFLVIKRMINESRKDVWGCAAMKTPFSHFLRSLQGSHLKNSWLTSSQAPTFEKNEIYYPLQPYFCINFNSQAPKFGHIFSSQNISLRGSGQFTGPKLWIFFGGGRGGHSTTWKMLNAPTQTELQAIIFAVDFENMLIDPQSISKNLQVLMLKSICRYIWVHKNQVRFSQTSLGEYAQQRTLKFSPNFGPWIAEFTAIRKWSIITYCLARISAKGSIIEDQAVGSVFYSFRFDHYQGQCVVSLVKVLHSHLLHSTGSGLHGKSALLFCYIMLLWLVHIICDVIKQNKSEVIYMNFLNIFNTTFDRKLQWKFDSFRKKLHKVCRTIEYNEIFFCLAIFMKINICRVWMSHFPWSHHIYALICFHVPNFHV